MLSLRPGAPLTTRYDQLQTDLKARPRAWLVTGVAGFIGSNLLEALLGLGQQVVGLDNFSTGTKGNLAEVQTGVSPAAWSRFRFIEGDIRDLATCQAACADVDIVLHQAALGSVPRSLADPLATHASNVDGFVNLLVAARDQKVGRFVFASSSSVYGDDPSLPKREDRIGAPLSPYALTKAINEQYAAVFARAYEFPFIGLRYFNVFGRRQSPSGPYAAVIPRWIASFLAGETGAIHGDGESSRDFSHVSDVVQANLLAGTTLREEALCQIYNVSHGARTTLNSLYQMIQRGLAERIPALQLKPATYSPTRPGDVRHSQADTSKLSKLLDFQSAQSFERALGESLDWYCREARSLST